jgi:hypothetical protein
MTVCVVHIGDIKSGTTSIQAALRAGNIPDVGKKVVYPCQDLNHNNLARIFANRKRLQASQVNHIRQQLIQSRDADLCILSGERLSTVTPTLVKQELEKCFGDLVSEFRVIHYIRPHFGRTVSAYSEQVKIGATERSLPDFVKWVCETNRFAHMPRLSAWRSVFGAGYQVRPMLRNMLYRNDVVADFFESVLGHVPIDWPIPPQVNVSLTASGITHVMRLQSQLKGKHPSLRHAIGYEFEERYSKLVGTTKDPITLNSTAAKILYVNYLKDAQECDKFLETPFLVNSLETDAISYQRVGLDPSLPVDRKEVDSLISHLIELSNTENEKQRAKQIRQMRFARYLALSSTPSHCN